MHFPHTDWSAPTQKNRRQIASISLRAQAGKLSAIIA